MKILSKYGIKFRAAMNVYTGNYPSIENTLKLAKETGATCFSFSPTLDTGRGKNMEMLNFE